MLLIQMTYKLLEIKMNTTISLPYVLILPQNKSMVILKDRVTMKKNWLQLVLSNARHFGV
jgi:hypothetical protein